MPSRKKKKRPLGKAKNSLRVSFKNFRSNLTTTDLKPSAVDLLFKDWKASPFKAIGKIRSYGWKAQKLKTQLAAVRIIRFEADKQNKLLVTLQEGAELKPGLFGSPLGAAILGLENAKTETPLPSEIIVQGAVEKDEIEIQLEEMFASLREDDSGAALKITKVEEPPLGRGAQKVFRFHLESDDESETTTTPPIATLGREPRGGKVSVSGGGGGVKSGGKSSSPSTITGKRTERSLGRRDDDDDEEQRKRPFRKTPEHAQDVLSGDDSDDENINLKKRVRPTAAKKVVSPKRVKKAPVEAAKKVAPPKRAKKAPVEDVPEEGDSKKRTPPRDLKNTQLIKRQRKISEKEKEDEILLPSESLEEDVEVPKNKPLASPDQGFPTTTEALTDREKIPILMVQYGGGEGSYAGDAALLTLRKSRRAFSIDFGGTELQRKRADDLRKAERKSAPEDSESSEFESDDDSPSFGRDLGMNTHRHKDHIGDQTPTTIRKFDKFFIGESVPQKVVQHPKKPKEFAPNVKQFKLAAPKIAKKPKQDTEDNNILFSWVAKKNKQPNNRISIAGLVIKPDTSKLKEGDGKDNERSLGVLVKVEKRDAKAKKKRAFTMLTLGDMEPNEAQKSVLKAWKDDGSKPVDVIKMAHHGSDDNIDAIPKETITAGHTELIVSGYTMKSTKKLIEFLKATNPKQVTFLFDTSKRAKDFLELATVKNLLEQKPAKVNVVIAKDYVMAVNTEGELSLQATRW